MWKAFIERYKWQTSYHICIKYVLEKSAFSTLLIFYFISCEVGLCTQPSSIHLNTQPYHDSLCFRLILYDLYFLKNSLTSTIKRLATKKDLGPFKIDRAVVDSSRSVNLPFDIRKILCTYPWKRYHRSSNVSDRPPVIVPGWRADLHPPGRFVCFMVRF